jgi:chloramphenicol-sensitive protein RarD
VTQAGTAKGILLALIANFIWGIAALYWIQTKPIGPVDVMAHRALWTLPVTFFIVLFFGRLSETLALMRSLKFCFWIALAALMLTINWGVYVFAVTNERATEASLGYFMLPLLTIALGVFMFGERPKPVHILAILLAIIAVLVQLFAYGSLPWVSLTLAMSFALYGAIRKQISADSMQGLFLESLCMAPFAAIWILSHDGAGMGVHGLKVDLFLLCAGAFTAAPLLTYVAATRVLALSTIGLLTYVGPSIQLIVALFVLKEPITTVTIATFGLVWLGVIAVTVEAGYSARKLRKFRTETSQKL